MKVTPYISTLGTARYKELLASPFDFSMLETHFNGWKLAVKDTYFYGYVTISLLLTPQYEVEIHGEKYIFPIPQTLNDFINDMQRVKIDLYWGDWMEREYEPKDFLPQNEIETYYENLLNEIDKGHELLIEKEGNENESKS